MEDVRLMSVKEVMKYIPMSQGGISKAIKAKRIPATRIGGRIFIPSWWVKEKLSGPQKEE